ncbi:hypothetical protein Tco_1576083, partial [Tanacetum coccineum]
LGWNLEEIHVTWAHLEKKRTRLRTCTKIHQEVLFSERGDGVIGLKRRRRDLSGDGVWILVTASQHSRLKVDLEPSMWRRRQKHQATPSCRYALVLTTLSNAWKILNKPSLNMHPRISMKQEVKEQGKEEDEMETNVEVKEVIEEEEIKFETDEEVEEILEEEEEDEDDENFNSFPTMKELSHHKWLLKNPRPPWIEAETDKISNFVRRVKSLKIFIGSFAYECDFMILEDTTSIIDRCLGEMVFGRPFIDKTRLVYDKEEGTVIFDEKKLGNS